MAMPAQRAPDRRWTEEEFYVAREAAPPGERWELVNGQWDSGGAVERFVLDLVQFFRDAAPEDEKPRQ